MKNRTTDYELTDRYYERDNVSTVAQQNSNRSFSGHREDGHRRTDSRADKEYATTTKVRDARTADYDGADRNNYHREDHRNSRQDHERSEGKHASGNGDGHNRPRESHARVREDDRDARRRTDRDDVNRDAGRRTNREDANRDAGRRNDQDDVKRDDRGRDFRR